MRHVQCPQVLGATLSMPGTQAPLVFQEVFEGNLLEREGMGDDDVTRSSIRLTINRIMSLVGLDRTTVHSQARLTWSAGRGAGTNTVIVDIGVGGTCVVLGAVNYLKIEIAHVTTIPVTSVDAAAQFEISWVKHIGGPVPSAFFTSVIGNVNAGTQSNRFAIPAYAWKGTILGDTVPIPSVALQPDPILVFFTDTLGVAVGASVAVAPAYALVPAGAELFSVVNTFAGNATFRVVWELRV